MKIKLLGLLSFCEVTNIMVISVCRRNFQQRIGHLDVSKKIDKTLNY